MQYLLYGSKKFHVLFTCSSVTLLKTVYQRKEMTYEQTAMVKEIITWKYHTDSSLESSFNFYTGNVMCLGD